MMKSLRSCLVIAAIGLSSAAFASGSSVGSQGSFSGSGQISAGAISGSANSFSEGNAVAASQVNGYGHSIQAATGMTGGSATIGGTITRDGAQVVTSTTQYAVTTGFGSVGGNAPINSGDAIANGNAAFGQTKVSAGGTAQFGTVAIGAYGSYKATQTIGGYGHR